jgi:hypothetical protein
MPDAPKRRFVTIVYEIVDDAAWSAGGNPLHYAHHGLKSQCVSVGDLHEELAEARRALDPKDEMTSLSVAEIVALRAI